MSIVSSLRSFLRRPHFAPIALLLLAPAVLPAQSPSAADGFDPNVNGTVYALAVQPDGKILVAGNFTSLQPNGVGTGTARNNIARLNPDGTLDASFNPNVNSQINALALQPDGKIVIGGVFTTVGGVSRNCLARLNADGTLDASINFTFANSPTPAINALVVQADGKIVVGGAFIAVLPAGASGAISRNRVARFNADGSLDASYNPNANATVYSLALEADGRILLGGLFTTLQPAGAAAATTRNHIARLNANGTLDPVFDPSANASVMVLTVQPDGDILIGGFFTALSPNGLATSIIRTRLARLNSDGTLDLVFNPNAGSNVTAIALQPDGGILVGGLFNNIGGGVRSFCARLGPAGVLDNFFDSGVNQVVNAFAVQADGKIVIGGNFVQLRPVGAIATTRNHLARLNTDGSPDVNFDPSLSGRVSALAAQSDGKVILGGLFSSIGGVARNNLARINANGTLDAGFNPNVNGTVSVVTVQADGKILVGGTFTTVAGVPRNNIARVNADGTLDATFDPNASAAVVAITLQADGKILIGGFFGALQPNGAATASLSSHLARLNADGTIDTTFATFFNGDVLSIKLLPDGKIIAGGNFIAMRTAEGGDFPTLQQYIVKLSATGVVDSTFSPLPNNRVNSLVIQSDGKIVIGGFFNQLAPNGDLNTVARNRVARLNPDGTLDASFDPSAGNEVRTVALQADGKILIGGIFPTVRPNGGELITRNYVARLNTDGTLDNSLDAKASGAVNAIIVQTDGKILLGGAFTALQPTGTPSVVSRNHLARLNTDGTLDSAYDPSFSNVAGTLVTALGVQADGKILLGGAFSSIGGTNGSNLVRFKPDGTLDSTFNPVVNGPVNAIGVQTNTGSTATQGNAFAWLNNNGLPLGSFVPSGDAQIVGQVNAIVRQADGSVLVGGSFANVSGATKGNLVRFKANGTLDTSFNPDPNGRVNAIVVQADGKIILGGSFTAIGSTTRNRMARLNVDGSLDSTYDPNLSEQVSVMLLQPDGKLLIGGLFASVQPNGAATPTPRNHIARLNADGTVETAFDPNANDQVRALALQADGKILMGGLFSAVKTTLRSRVARLNSDGSLDAGFDPNANGPVLAIKVQADGKILLGGTFTTICGWVRNFLARVLPDGGNDPGFDPNLNGAVSTLALQSDGQILIGGAYTSIGGTTRNNIGRISSTGAIDPNFDPNANDLLNTVALQADGTMLIGGTFTQLRPFGVILIGGAFNTISGAAVSNLALLNEDGNPNAGFRPDPNGAVNALALQPDGRVLVAGVFTTIAGTTRNRLARLNTDGTLDVAFNPNVNDQVNTVTLQADGKILIGGTFTSVGGTARSRIARLNADGSVDGTFNPGANDAVTTLVVQPNGSVVVGGTFTSVGGTARNRLARLGADGSIDGGFNPNANGAVNVLAVQADGRIIAGGAFTALGGTTRNYLARINADGSLDATFDPAADDVVYALTVQSDGKPVVGGAFARIGGQVRYRFARLAATVVAAQVITLSSDFSTLTWTRGGSAPELAWVTFEQSTDATTWTTLGQASRVGTSGSWRLGAAAVPSNVAVYVRARGALPASQYSSSGLIESVQKFAPLASSGAGSDTIGSIFFDANTSTYQVGLFSADGLPAGLSMDAVTGIVSGATNQTGTVTVLRTATNGVNSSTAPLTLVFGPPEDVVTHPVNASIRANVTKDHPIFLGFVVTGTEAKTVLLRGVGPGLSNLGVSGVLAAPHLLLFDASGRLLAENHGWANDSNLAAAFSTVGAFPFATNSGDSAIVATLMPGPYTMQVVDGSGSGGIALAEAYDASSNQATTTARFGNMSARGPSAGVGNPLIAGFVITGNAPKRLLVRGIGPALTGLGVTDALSDPIVGVYNIQGRLIAQNDNWTSPLTVDASQPAVDAATISASAFSVGAFALGSGGKDAVVIVTLTPGLYTVQVSGVNNVTGSALAELYELP